MISNDQLLSPNSHTQRAFVFLNLYTEKVAGPLDEKTGQSSLPKPKEPSLALDQILDHLEQSEGLDKEQATVSTTDYIGKQIVLIRKSFIQNIRAKGQASGGLTSDDRENIEALMMAEAMTKSFFLSSGVSSEVGALLTYLTYVSAGVEPKICKDLCASFSLWNNDGKGKGTYSPAQIHRVNNFIFDNQFHSQGSN